MVAAHDSLGFGNCTNIGECSAVCPKEIGLDTITRLNADLLASSRKAKKGHITAAP
jgi:succinate dehydrogenase / fumarate reductase iron-sulfur subunit